MGLYCALYVIVSPLRIPKTTSLKKSFNFSSRCFRYTTIFWGHCPMDGHLDHFQNFRNKNKDAKKTIELRPLGLACVFLWDRYYKRDGWVEALLWYTAKLALENTWSICSTEMKVGWNRALNFWCLPFFDIALFPVFHSPAPPTSTSTLADGFFCPLPLSALAYLQGALPCLWSIKSQGSLAYARSG